jgi:hypothetical protein
MAKGPYQPLLNLLQITKSIQLPATDQSQLQVKKVDYQIIKYTISQLDGEMMNKKNEHQNKILTNTTQHPPSIFLPGGVSPQRLPPIFCTTDYL